MRGEGDEALRQADLPLAVLGDELIVVDRALWDGLAIHDLRGQLLHLFLILRIFAADAILKFRGVGGLNLQDIGKAQLADDLEQLAALENLTGFF